MLSYLALGLALALADMALPVFNAFTGKELSLTGGPTDYLIFLIFIVAPLTGLLAGCYPALHLSAFRPAEVLKGKTGMAAGRSQYRKILVVLQFSISIGLIIATLTVGIETHELDKVPVRIYCLEKTLADCFKYRNKLGLDTAIEALRLYVERSDVNVDELMRFARICRVAKILRPYLEAML